MSIEAQSWQNIEVIISDDCSQNYEELLSALPPTIHPRAVSQSQDRLGMAKNWNRSAKFANGEFLLIVGQDDLLASNGIETLVTAAQRYGKAITFGGQGYVGAQGQPIRNPSLSIDRDSLFPAGDVILPARAVLALGLSYGNVLGDPCSTLISTGLFRATNGFSLEYRHAADLELWLRLATHGAEAVALGTQVAFHRSHSLNATSSHVKSGIAQADRLRLLSTFGKDFDDKVWNKSVGRLYFHAAYDLVRYRVPPSDNYPRLRGSYLSRALAIINEFLESFRLKPADISCIIKTN